MRLDKYIQLESKINEILLVQDAYTIEEKIAVLRKVFHILSPLGTDDIALEKVIFSARYLGLLSDSSHLLSDYKSFLSDSFSRGYDF